MDNSSRKKTLTQVTPVEIDQAAKNALMTLSKALIDKFKDSSHEPMEAFEHYTRILYSKSIPKEDEFGERLIKGYQTLIEELIQQKLVAIK